MAASFQQRALQRKIIYLTAVVALFTCSWLWRRNVVEASAQDLSLLEESLGDVDLGGSTLRMALTGARGFVTCALWHQAQDQQKKNQWSELEGTVRTLTKLQPHFLSPWLFQSWNLAWNVANESDRERDKYYYISRGIQLLAVGERQNRYQPNLRRDMGMYHINRICRLDQSNVMRSLFQLSCIPPADRDPAELAVMDNGRVKEIKWAKFEAFCKAHPQLVRRLHSPPLPYDPKREYRKFQCPEAKQVIEFLQANQYVPTLFVDKGEEGWDLEVPRLKENELDRFPILPPARPNPEYDNEQTQENLAANRDDVRNWIDGYVVARAWYGYAQEVLPDRSDLPGEPAPIKPADRGRKRLNKGMRTIIFRCSPCQAQTFLAERLQEEGWFSNDDEPFLVTRWFPNNRFSGPNGEPGQGGPSRIPHAGPDSLAAWFEANRIWQDFGEKNKLTEKEFLAVDRRQLVDALRKRYQLGPDDPFPSISEEDLKNDETLKKQFEALFYIRAQAEGKRLVNFDSFLMRSSVEMEKKTARARSLIYKAEHQVAAGARREGMKTYELPDALPGWRAILETDDPVKKEYRASDFIQEWTYEVELKYMAVYRPFHEGNLSRDLALESYLGQVVAPPALGADWAMLGTYTRPQFILLPELDITGPFHRDSRGAVLIRDDVKELIESRHGLRKSKPPPTPGQTPPQGVPLPVKPERP